MSAALKLREEWLRKAGDMMASVIGDAAGVALDKWRVSCGFMAQGVKAKAIGQCWHAEASKDGHSEIFITPLIDDSRTVAAILAHELIHAALPSGTGHKKPFQIAARAIGFAKPFTKLNPTDALWAMIDPIIEALGPYPHAEMNVTRAAGAPKKQASRMVKCHCVECGYTVRSARKWIVAKGAPHCPEHGAMVCEGVGGEDDGDAEAEAA